jgi:hypothetical protein
LLLFSQAAACPLSTHNGWLLFAPKLKLKLLRWRGCARPVDLRPQLILTFSLGEDETDSPITGRDYRHGRRRSEIPKKPDEQCGRILELVSYVCSRGVRLRSSWGQGRTRYHIDLEEPICYPAQPINSSVCLSIHACRLGIQ